MRMPPMNDIVGAVIFGVELAVVAIAGTYLLSMSPVKLPDKIAGYKYLSIAIVLFVIGMFFKSATMFKLAAAFLAFQVMVVAEEKIDEMLAKKSGG